MKLFFAIAGLFIASAACTGGSTDDGSVKPSSVSQRASEGASCSTNADCDTGLECEVEVEHGVTTSICKPHNTPGGGGSSSSGAAKGHGKNGGGHDDCASGAGCEKEVESGG